MPGLVEWASGASGSMPRAWRMISRACRGSRVVKAHALGELAEEPDVGAGFAGWLDGLLGELDEVVAVGALNVGVFEEGGGGEDVVGVVGGVGKEELVDDGEEVVAGKAAADGVLIGRDGGGVGVVDKEGMDGRAVS